MIQVQDVIDKIKSLKLIPNEALIHKAYEYSAKAHSGQKRKSGHPFVIHPLEVAMSLAEMRLDDAAIAAGILHDTIEDTETTKETISQEFGPEIAELVDGVTKLSKIQFNTQEDREAENFRKMILAISKDIRVLMIKLADRLNNLKTLQFMTEEKQRQIAQETLDIYAPLANRLGMQWIKIQLEDLSFSYLKPEIFKIIQRKISRIKKNREQYIDRINKAVMSHLQEHVGAIEIVGRMKHVFSIYKKMERQNITFEQVHDLMAFRIVTNTVEQCYEILGHLHSIWKPVPGRFKDYIAMPKENDYQSLHTTVICLDGERVEFQIRTEQMNDFAEQGIAAHWKYKEGGRLDVKTEKDFQWLRRLVDWQDELKDSIEFLDTVKLDMFAQDVYAFTPKGDVRALPYGATPLDFAYSIHTDVGTHCAGAKINGKIMPLNHKIESGDEIEILTNPNLKPTKEWLNLVTSSRAKARIRQYLKEEQQAKSLKLGQALFEEECQKREIKLDEVLNNAEFVEYLRKKGITGQDSFYSAVSYGKIALPSLFKTIFPNTEETVGFFSKDGMLRRIFRKATQKNKNFVQVDGLDEILVTFGKCCSPVTGDRIVGLMMRGRGVTVHRLECVKVADIDPERRVNATWEHVSSQVRTAKLRISTVDKTGILASIAQSVSDKKIGISKALVKTTKDEKALVLIHVGVTNVAQLHTLMKSIEKIKGVISVEREMG